MLHLTTISICRNVQVGVTAYVEQTANEIHVLISTLRAFDTVRYSRRRRNLQESSVAMSKKEVFLGETRHFSVKIASSVCTTEKSF